MIDAATLYRPDPAYLRSLIERSGRSQRECARIIGVDDASLRRWLMTPPRARIPYSAQVCLELLAAMRHEAT